MLRSDWCSLLRSSKLIKLLGLWKSLDGVQCAAWWTSSARLARRVSVGMKKQANLWQHRRGKVVRTFDHKVVLVHESRIWEYIQNSRSHSFAERFSTKETVQLISIFNENSPFKHTHFLAIINSEFRATLKRWRGREERRKQALFMDPNWAN